MQYFQRLRHEKRVLESRNTLQGPRERTHTHARTLIDGKLQHIKRTGMMIRLYTLLLYQSDFRSNVQGHVHAIGMRVGGTIAHISDSPRDHSICTQ